LGPSIEARDVAWAYRPCKERNDEGRGKASFPSGCEPEGSSAVLQSLARLAALLRDYALHPTPRVRNAIRGKSVSRPCPDTAGAAPARTSN